MSDPLSNTDNTKLLPYFLILFGMSAGLSSVVTLVAEFKQELGFSNFEIGLTIFCGFASSFIALITLSPLADRGRSPILLKSGLLLGIIALFFMAVGDSLWYFIIGRSLFGFALGAASPAARRTVIVANPDELGKNLGKLGRGTRYYCCPKRCRQFQDTFLGNGCSPNLLIAYSMEG